MAASPRTRSLSPRRILISTLLAGCVLFFLAHEAAAQCAQRANESARHGARNNLSLELNTDQPQTVTVQITGPGIAKPLAYKLCAGQGKQGVGIYVPPGQNRGVSILVLDGQGKVTHRGETTISVQAGPMASTIVPLQTVQAKAPLRATIGTYRVTVKQEPSKDGKSLNEHVEVLDPEGKPAKVRADQITLRAASEPIEPVHPAPQPSLASQFNIKIPIIGPNDPVVICILNRTCVDLPPPFIPIELPGRFVAIAAGGLGELPETEFTCAIDVNGQAWCWGENENDELASNIATTSTCESLFPCSLVPVPVNQGKVVFSQSPPQGAPPGSVNLTAGSDFACALDTTGAAWCWGGSLVNRSHQEVNFGELGVTGGPFPVQVGGTPFAAAHKFFSLSAGGNHACGITTERTLFCWGRNTSGELGINSTNPVGPPTQVNILGETLVTQVAAGTGHTCAITGDAKMFCWGDDVAGELGIDFTTTATEQCPGILANTGQQFCMMAPVQVPTVGKVSGLWDRVSAGADFTCGRDQTTSQLFCWGTDTDSQLGVGPTSPPFGTGVNPFPQLVPTPATPNLIASHEDQSCGIPFELSGPGNLFCWGMSTSALPAVLTPTSVPGHALLQFSPGGTQTCAIDINGVTWCWGDNTLGELGNGTTTSSPIPVAVVP
jgi:alpha-tubulin suppressor-like RCC1 family protein